MSTFPTKILLATDGSKHANLAARSAIELANKTGSELHVVFVGALADAALGYLEMDQVAMFEELSRQILDKQVRRIKSKGGKIAEAYMRLGDEAERIVTLGEEIGAGLIVVGSQGGTALKRATMGSVSESVVRHAHCPVLVVRKDGE